jgi:hypothetical protein
MEQPRPNHPDLCPFCGSAKINPLRRPMSPLVDDHESTISGILSNGGENGYVLITAGLHL